MNSAKTVVPKKPTKRIFPLARDIITVKLPTAYSSHTLLLICGIAIRTWCVKRNFVTVQRFVYCEFIYFYNALPILSIVPAARYSTFWIFYIYIVCFVTCYILYMFLIKCISFLCNHHVITDFLESKYVDKSVKLGRWRYIVLVVLYCNWGLVLWHGVHFLLLDSGPSFMCHILY
jgi:hypothetical protein